MERLLSGDKNHRNRNLKIALVVGLFVLGAIVLVFDFVQAAIKIDGTLSRNGYGDGDRIEEVEAEVDENGERIPLEVHISERQYTEEEAQEMFGRVIRRMDTLILGENESLDRVETDLNLITEVPDEPVDVSWELDHYQIMNVRGELISEDLSEEGTMIQLKAVLTYTEDETKQAMYECSVCVYPRTLSNEEESVRELTNEIEEKEAETKTEAVWQLPEKIKGKTIEYYKKMEFRGVVLMGMAVCIAILLYALQKQNQMQEQKQRKQQMMLDYPEIINKLTLFLGAGMTVKRSWRKIVEDYEAGKAFTGQRYAYEEMKQTCYEMESGVAETESYEAFGRRCNVQVYIKLGALLSQNLRKGTRGLNEILRMESVQAFEERKAAARRAGEEAGTKLLLPMFMMLAIVLIIVIVPAFLSMQI